MKSLAFAVTQDSTGNPSEVIEVADRNIISYHELRGDAERFIAMLDKEYVQDNKRKIKDNRDPIRFILYTGVYAPGTMDIVHFRKAPQP